MENYHEKSDAALRSALDTNSADLTYNATKAAIGMIPVVGSGLVGFLDSIVDSRTDRVAEVVNVILQRVKHLEGVIKNPATKRLTERAAYQAALSVHGDLSDRKEFIASLIAKVDAGDLGEAIAYRYLEILDSLDSLELLHFLKYAGVQGANERVTARLHEVNSRNAYNTEENTTVNSLVAKGLLQRRMILKGKADKPVTISDVCNNTGVITGGAAGHGLTRLGQNLGNFIRFESSY